MCLRCLPVVWQRWCANYLVPYKKTWNENTEVRYQQTGAKSILVFRSAGPFNSQWSKAHCQSHSTSKANRVKRGGVCSVEMRLPEEQMPWSSRSTGCWFLAWLQGAVTSCWWQNETINTGCLFDRRRHTRLQRLLVIRAVRQGFVTQSHACVTSFYAEMHTCPETVSAASCLTVTP